ncbi:Golgi transport complex subunit 5-domain-containing protein [Elsinoe ampelina]|uniref:Conserved oligomeric Golgi complex subunit 5 n=1 Tax=Elsinoe ampelina TaxID=302913 RepID=A0A6A6GFR1_9PEZI|nr:Golgi transport complex subunit 5-domain-containing protein [Elsinoe ampelina]
MATEEPSYIDYDTFLDPDFSPTAFANTLVLSTNDPTDTPLDLSTPLSRVLFDVQEVDIHIDNLTTRSAVPLLDYTQTRADASSHILEEVSTQLESLNEGYKRLEKDVIERYEKAEQVRLAAERLCETLKLGRVVSRCLNLGRQLELQMEELGINISNASSSAPGNSAKVRENHRSMVAASHTVLELRSVLSNPTTTPGLERVTTVTTLKNSLFTPLERALISLAQQTIREFSISSLPSPSTVSSPAANLSTTTFAQSEAAKSRTTSALTSLYLLSPCPIGTKETAYEPKLLLNALTSYLQANLTSSQASLARALATLPTLERTLAEVGGRCANVVALEQVLSSTQRGVHPYLTSSAPLSSTNGPTSDSDASSSDSDSDSPGPPPVPASKSRPNPTKSPRAKNEDRPLPGHNLTTSPLPLLPLLLQSLDTSSLPSYFWRTLASGMTARVMEILGRGGVSARTLRSNKDRVAGVVRGCVLDSSKGAGENGGQKKFDREAAVMVGSIVGVLGR